MALEDAVREAYASALARQPDGDELRGAVEFVRTQAGGFKADGKANGFELALTGFCQAMFGLNEFIYVE